MITVTESGMTFGPFDERSLFKVEDSPFVRRLNRIKACELAYWNGESNRLVFIEAKSSIPDPHKSPERFEAYFSDMLEKFDNALQMLVAGALIRSEELSDQLEAGIAQVNWSQATILFYLVIPEAPLEVLGSLTEKLRKVMHRQISVWRANAFVINRHLAYRKGIATANV